MSEHTPTSPFDGLILAADTSTMTQSVALVHGTTLRASRTHHSRRGHADKLLGIIDELLGACGARITDVGLMVVGTGPGSFTGLRIGLACLKGLAFANQIPLVGASSLRAMAHQSAPRPGLVVPLNDARKREVYTGLYRWQGERCVAVMDDAAMKPDQLAETILEHHRDQEPVVLLGGGLGPYGAMLKEALAPHVSALTLLGDAYGHPSAAHMATTAAAEVDLNALPDLTMLEPNYQRPSDAELKFGPPGKMR